LERIRMKNPFIAIIDNLLSATLAKTTGCSDCWQNASYLLTARLAVAGHAS